MKYVMKFKHKLLMIMPLEKLSVSTLRKIQLTAGSFWQYFWVYENKKLELEQTYYHNCDIGLDKYLFQLKMYIKVVIYVLLL